MRPLATTIENFLNHGKFSLLMSIDEEAVKGVEKTRKTSETLRDKIRDMLRGPLTDCHIYSSRGEPGLFLGVLPEDTSVAGSYTFNLYGIEDGKSVLIQSQKIPYVIRPKKPT